MIDNLNLDNQQRNKFLNLAAEGRGEIPADIARLIADHPQALDKIRKMCIRDRDRPAGSSGDRLRLLWRAV